MSQRYIGFSFLFIILFIILFTALLFELNYSYIRSVSLKLFIIIFHCKTVLATVFLHSLNLLVLFRRQAKRANLAPAGVLYLFLKMMDHLLSISMFVKKLNRFIFN